MSGPKPKPRRAPKRAAKQDAPAAAGAALAGVRAEIDAIDAKLQELISARARIAQTVGVAKRATGTADFYRPEREAEVLRRVVARNDGPLSNEEMVRLYREIMSACLAQQEPLKIAFLGPEGTFSEEALLANMPGEGYHPFPYPSIREVLKAVQSGEAPLGLVPIENSIEGSVVVTLDSLAFGFDELRVVREITHQVHQQLIARRPIELDRVTKIVSIPHAYGQCREFIRAHLDGVEHEPTDSTAEAVRRVSRVDRPWVAIGTRLAADMYECAVIADDIDDAEDNRTRFVFVARDEADLCDKRQVEQLFKRYQPTHVLHCAAKLQAIQIMTDRPIDFWLANVTMPYAHGAANEAGVSIESGLKVVQQGL